MVKKYRIYTDGSFNKNVPNEAHGGIVYWDVENNKMDSCAHLISRDPMLTQSWNIGGECLAAYVALKSIYMDLVEAGHNADCDPVIIEIIHDYEGVGHWITGVYKRRKTPVSIWYYDKVMALKKSLPNVEVRFTWVKAHGSDAGNNMADSVASYSMRYCKDYDVPIYCFDDPETNKLKID